MFHSMKPPAWLQRLQLKYNFEDCKSATENSHKFTNILSAWSVDFCFDIYLKIANINININLLARLRNECSLEYDWQND